MLHAGIDIGGTKIKAGIIEDNNFHIVAQSSDDFPHEDYRRVCDVIEGQIRDMACAQGISVDRLGSIGVAVPGSIDPTGSLVLHAHNLGFHDVPIKAEISRRFPGMPVFIGNDADTAALAELHGGVFIGAKTAVLITIGTGVGGGLILGGKLFKGGLGHGVEPGHMTLIYGGDLCSCGNRGCVEVYCSATWLARRGQELITGHRESLVCLMAGNDVKSVDARLVIEAAKQGDVPAVEIFDTYIDNLSAAISSITSLLDPEVIAIGGGVSGAGDFLYQPLRKAVEEKSSFKADYRIVPAALGNNAGIIGAALLHRE